MNQLKPCPFCGGEASVVGKPHEAKFCVGCGDDTCLDFSGLGWLYDTDDDAAAAWNRREERTCRIVVDHGRHGPEPRFDGDVWTVHYTCSECGWPIGRKDAYCSHCGAKVGGVDADQR